MMIRLQLLLATLCSYIVLSTSSTLSAHLLPPTPRNYIPSLQPTNKPVYSSETPGFMQRIARWFGFAKQPKEQSVEASNYYPQYKDKPMISTRQQQLQYQQHNYHYNRSKIQCNLCNKIPWIPMFPENMHYPVLKSHSQLPQLPQVKFNYLPPNTHHVSTFNPTQSSSSSLYYPNYVRSVPVQRAIKFKTFNIATEVENKNSDLIIGVPSNVPHHISSTPVVNFNATSFPSSVYNTFNSKFTKIDNNQFNANLKSNRKEEYFDNRDTTTVRSFVDEITTQQQSDSSFEIVKSVPVADFVSSIEYPPNVVQSPVVDISYQQPEFEKTENDQTSQNPNLVKSDFSNDYKLSEIDFKSNPIVVYNRDMELDSYPEASSHNVSFQEEQLEKHSNFESSIEKSQIPIQDNKIFVTSYADTIGSTEKSETTLPNEIYPEYTTTPIASIPTTTFYPFVDSSVLETNSIKKERQTPKRLLDSPIFYITGSSPRPFTKDPSDLKIQNHKKRVFSPSWEFLPTALPTSSYPPFTTEQWIGLGHPFQSGPSSLTPSPPPPSFSSSSPSQLRNSSNEKRPKYIQQIIIPYTTKIKPRPFRIREEQNDQPQIHDDRFINFVNLTELQNEQESKSFSETDRPAKRTTQHLTKIFAFNLRDLLKKEQEIKNISKNSFDIRKLQKNIDDWTEQEFTSSKKITTVSVRGRSKHIPTEYLTTTSFIEQTDTTPSVNSVSSFNPIKNNNQVIEEKLDKFHISEKLIQNNEINSIDSSQLYPIDSNPAETITTTSRAITTTTTNSKLPFYIKSLSVTPSFNDLWKNLKITISPFTNEKVYIVTPQPSVQYDNLLNTFKSPRFFIRPTPADSIKQLRNTKPYTPKLFGLMDISSYSPPAPVETLDGHSKVIKIVTSSVGTQNPIINNNENTFDITDKKFSNQNKS